MRELPITKYRYSQAYCYITYDHEKLCTVKPAQKREKAEMISALRNPFLGNSISKVLFYSGSNCYDT